MFLNFALYSVEFFNTFVRVGEIVSRIFDEFIVFYLRFISKKKVSLGEIR